MIQRAVIAGGKTGGHLYPGIAVAEEILARNPEADITFIGTQDGIESRVLPGLGFALHTITVSRLKGAGIFSRLMGLLRVPVGLVQSWRLLRKVRPQVVLGVGGYASGPALLAAWCARYPTAIQEQNATPGFTNRILGRLVRAVYLGFGAARAHFASHKVVETGNPIRRALREQLTEAVENTGTTQDAEGFSLLVFGGSQGSRFLNEKIPEAVHCHLANHPDFQLRVTHQTGLNDEESTRERYQNLELAELVEVVPYIDDMPTAYAAADAAICRAGALTVAEVTAVGLPCLLVPFPYAADNHQEANAQVLVDADAGSMLRQEQWTTDEVSRWLLRLGTEPERRGAVSRNARSLARPEATQAVVDHLEVLAA